MVGLHICIPHSIWLDAFVIIHMHINTHSCQLSCATRFQSLEPDQGLSIYPILYVQPLGKPCQKARVIIPIGQVLGWYKTEARDFCVSRLISTPSKMYCLIHFSRLSLKLCLLRLWVIQASDQPFVYITIKSLVYDIINDIYSDQYTKNYLDASTHHKLLLKLPSHFQKQLSIQVEGRNCCLGKNSQFKSSWDSWN